MRVSTVYHGDVQHSWNRRRDRVGRGFGGFVRASPVSFTWRTPKDSKKVNVSLPKVYLLQNWRSAQGPVQVRRALSAEVGALPFLTSLLKLSSSHSVTQEVIPEMLRSTIGRSLCSTLSLSHR